jgi:hypothetical protein
LPEFLVSVACWPVEGENLLSLKQSRSRYKRL